MKTFKYIFFGLLVSIGLQFALAGCVGEVGVSGGPWYHDGPWLDGGRWGGPRGVGYIDVHPPGWRR